MKKEISFDPVKVAYYEKAGWEAYYARDWARAFRLMVALNREQFRMSPWTALLAALDIVRASRAFAPLEGNDVLAATRHLRNFYTKARRSLQLAATAETLARLEMEYWVVHRKLAIERQAQPERRNEGPMVEALARLHAVLFDLPAEAARRSAEKRALAALAVDRITGRYSSDVAEDWRRVEAHLRQAYELVADSRGSYTDENPRIHAHER